MGMTQKTPMVEIDRYIEEQLKRMTEALIRNLQYVGERTIIHARSLPSPSAAAFKGKRIPPHQPNYIDWTANLRSSIGYVIASDGKIVSQSTFENTASGAEGAKSGIQYAKEVVRKFPEGIVLIVVAGMQYASYVSGKGYDVLDSAELLADRLVPQMLRQLGFIND